MLDEPTDICVFYLSKIKRVLFICWGIGDLPALPLVWLISTWLQGIHKIGHEPLSIFKGDHQSLIKNNIPSAFCCPRTFSIEIAIMTNSWAFYSLDIILVHNLNFPNLLLGNIEFIGVCY